MKGLGYLTLVGLLLVGQGQAQDQCTGTEQVERAHRKLQEQLDRTKIELDSWQNQTLQFMQCPDKSSISFEEVKILFRKVQKQIQENQNELKTDIQQLINNTADASSCQFQRPAISCQQIAVENPSSLPGYKWVLNTYNSPTLVYCTLSTQCCSNAGGWMRIAHIDMTNPYQSCPANFRQIGTPKRACGRKTTSGGCNSVSFSSSGIQYQKVCGRIVGFHDGSPSGFYTPRTGNDIDSAYIDGISLTHGQNPRKHIWSFANALQEVLGFDSNRHICPCTNRQSTMQRYIPSFVGNDYFCDSGSRTTGQVGRLYTDDPLWDGQGCEAESTCCTFNNPPWFCKTLPQPTSDDIEVRVCADEGYANEDSPFELIEIYVQ